MRLSLTPGFHRASERITGIDLREDAIREQSTHQLFFVALLAWAFFLVTPSCMASAALFLEEPFGHFGGVNPTGHSAVYLNHVCAAAPERLRLCAPEEPGVVVSRYHKVAGYDWLAVPLIPYLYSVASLSEVPASVSPATVPQIRNSYRHNYLQRMAPDAPDGGTPPGGVD